MAQVDGKWVCSSAKGLISLMMQPVSSLRQGHSRGFEEPHPPTPHPPTPVPHTQPPHQLRVADGASWVIVCEEADGGQECEQKLTTLHSVRAVPMTTRHPWGLLHVSLTSLIQPAAAPAIKFLFYEVLWEAKTPLASLLGSPIARMHRSSVIPPVICPSEPSMQLVVEASAKLLASSEITSPQNL